MTSQISVPYSTDEMAALGPVAAQIIPASQTYGQPGADDPDILKDILTSGAHLHDKLAYELAWLSGKILHAVVATDFQRVFPAEVDAIQTLTVQCYYRDARVMWALNIDVRPPFPGGYTQELNDFSLLDPVHQWSEIYRKVL